MAMFALKPPAGESLDLEAQGLTVGRGTGYLQTTDRKTLLFSTADRARSWLGDRSLAALVPVRVEEALAGICNATGCFDHSTAALIDGEVTVGFFSCDAIGWLLPTHFYRATDLGLATLGHGNEWRPVEVVPARPSCLCGGLLGPYDPRPLAPSKVKKIPGLFQVLAATFERSDDERAPFETWLLVDLARPKKSCFLEFYLHFEDEERPYWAGYSLSPEGAVSLEGSRFELRPREPWAPCPHSGLVTLAELGIRRTTRLKAVEIQGKRWPTGETYEVLITTGSMARIPLIKEKRLARKARGALEAL